MSLEAIAYTSSAVPGLTEASLEHLLTRARRNNEVLGVSGVLLFHDGSFLQYFEGPPEAVRQVYERIQRSPMHRDIIELIRGPIEERSFSNWLMGFTRVPESSALQMSNASWKTRLSQANRAASAADSDGLDLLKQFWASNRGAG